jgi:type IV pilus assembly protein PilB
MQSHVKRLGEMLVDAGLITPAQLQEALRHQRFAGGRMGTNLVALGFVSEEVLMDFLAHQTGVPRADFRTLNVDSDVLKRIPRRLAEQLTILPIEFKEPKTLVLAMADPSDLNAIDSARFASGLTIDPVVASHSALRAAIAEQYRKLDPGSPTAITVEVGPPLNLDDGLPVNFEIPALGAVAPPKPPPVTSPKSYPLDPFFDGSQPAASLDPFGLFDAQAVEPPPVPAAPELPPALLSANPTSTFPGASGGLIPSRSAKEGRTRSLETFQTRTIVHGLVRLLQKRGVLGEDELQRFLSNLIENGLIKEDGRE